jgi:hypothetical protein
MQLLTVPEEFSCADLARLTLNHKLFGRGIVLKGYLNDQEIASFIKHERPYLSSKHPGVEYNLFT